MEQNSEIQPNALRPAGLHKAIVISRFGDVKYSCQKTSVPSWFHTIVFDKWSVYIEEFEEEIIASVWHNKTPVIIGIDAKSIDDVLSEVEDIVKHGL